MSKCNCTPTQRNKLDVVLELTLYYLDTLHEDDITYDEIEETFTRIHRIVNSVHPI